MWYMNDVIREGMPEASFKISFNCIADLVSINDYVGILLGTGPDSKYN